MATGLKAGRSQARDGAPAPRRPTLREQQKQFTRDRLLTAALAAFVENGYTPARIEDVAARAGASRATFYLHFGGKAEIVHALMDMSTLAVYLMI